MKYFIVEGIIKTTEGMNDSLLKNIWLIPKDQ